MKFIILLLFTAYVKSETPNWTPIGSPLITAYPCEQTEDIVTWFDPSLPPREKNRYYVFIHRAIPANSRITLEFDSHAYVVINFRTEPKKYIRHQFKKGLDFMFRFFVDFKGIGFIVKGAVPGIIPYFRSITINYEQVCYRPRSDYLDHYISETLTSGPQENCGVRKVKLRKNLGNTIRVTRPGEWPWQAAIYRYENEKSKYTCGGTLISKTFVLTAAHCASLRGVPLSAEVLNVILGKYNLKKHDVGSQKKEVHRIILHEGFVYTDLYADIALLQLKSEATFTTYVQPACLWYSKAMERLPNTTIMGTVAGWGLSGTATLSRRLKQAVMPMVSESECAYNSLVSELIDSTKFCAGYLNGTAACNGDSGSAFQVFVPDEVQTSNKTVSGAWHVRGIVSLTVSKAGSPVCEPNQYAVFTNIKSYRVWIDAYIDSEDY